METILNRWRGTGTIFYKITGVHIYALYLVLLIGFLSTYYYGILAVVLFLIGESFAWGKWVGYLVSDNGEKEYWNDNGKNFPFIHQIANNLVDELECYKSYCQVALAIRGFIWWTPLLVLLGYINLLSWYQVVANTIILSIGFPIACELSKKWKFNYQSKYLMIDTNWEKQEVIYGFIQFICLTFSIFIFAIIK